MSKYICTGCRDGNFSYCACLDKTPEKETTHMLTPPTTDYLLPVSADMKEIAGRLSKLSFRDMLSLSDRIKNSLKEPSTAQDIAEALLRTADTIGTAPLADPLSGKPYADPRGNGMRIGTHS